MHHVKAHAVVSRPAIMKFNTMSLNSVLVIGGVPSSFKCCLALLVKHREIKSGPNSSVPSVVPVVPPVVVPVVVVPLVAALLF